LDPSRQKRDIAMPSQISQERTIGHHKSNKYQELKDVCWMILQELTNMPPIAFWHQKHFVTNPIES
jgi:hypothetical protein